MEFVESHEAAMNGAPGFVSHPFARKTTSRLGKEEARAFSQNRRDLNWIC